MKSVAYRRTTRTPPPRRRPKAQRHLQILAAAFEEFASNGFAAARLEDVAKRAEIAKGTIYLHFKNKEVLFRAVVRSLIHPVFEKFEELAETFPGPAAGLVREFLSRQYSEVVKNPKAHTMLRLLISESGKFPQLADVYRREVLDPGVAALRLILQRGAATGEFRESRIDDFPQILVAPAVLAVVWILILGNQHNLDLDAYFQAHLEFVLAGLRRTSFS